MCRKLMMALMTGGLAALGSAHAGEDRGMLRAQAAKTTVDRPRLKAATPDKPLGPAATKPPAQAGPAKAACPVTRKPLTNSNVVREWGGKRVALLDPAAAARWDKYGDAKKAKRLAAVTNVKGKK